MGKKDEVAQFVERKIHFLQEGKDGGENKAVLANLQRGVGCEPGELPQLFGIILMDMPKKFMSEDGVPTKEEWSCYIALTLYALHQQGNEMGNRSMHTEECIDLGTAMWELASSYEDSNAEQRMLQRMRMLSTSADMKELSYHLRGVVQLLKSKGIPLNYRILAADLYELQCLDGKKHVHLRWGQSFFQSKTRSNASSK